MVELFNSVTTNIIICGIDMKVLFFSPKCLL
uniref:Uncharacterized protein n=1 Tax=Rhizophora mucronata TaxID=61149 RepID=A0A2P2NBP3_RHIMU